MHGTIAFTTVRGPFGWLGNMAPFPIRHQGKTWRTTEALFQAMRFTDEAVREEVRRQKSPMAAKFVAKKHGNHMAVTPRSPEDLAIMETVIRLKLDQHSGLRDKLLATGQSEIIEDCTRRPRGSGLFWGAVLKDGQWIGENRLGKLWMSLREEFRCEAAPDQSESPALSPGKCSQAA